MTQDQIISKLERMGFVFNHDDGETVYMMKKRGGQTRYADVDKDGTVSGMYFDDFIKSLK